MTKNPEPPSAPPRPRRLTHHGHERIDPWFWLRDDTRSNSEILALLEAENQYTRQMLAPAAELKQQLLQEMIGRVVADDDTVPVRRGDWFYSARYRGDQEHPVYVRCRSAGDAAAQTILDANERAKDHSYYRMGQVTASDDHRRLAFTEDVVGRGLYQLRIRSPDHSESFAEVVENTDGGLAWSACGEYLFYVRKHPATLLPFQVWRHRLGTDPAGDTLCLEERDPAFVASVHRGHSGDYIYIHLGSTLSDEVWLLSADDPTGAFALFCPREAGHEYSVADARGRFFVRSNWQAVNFCLLECSLTGASDRQTWRQIVPPSDHVLLEDFEVFDHHLVLNERRDGLLRLRVLDLEGSPLHEVDSPEPAFTTALQQNVDSAAGFVRYGYGSLTTPWQVWDLDLRSGERLLRKSTRVPGSFDPSDYCSQRLTVRVRDGATVPVSLVYRTDGAPLDERPLLIYGYGAYGLCVDPEFSQTRLSLLDRQVIFAIAHVRGGEDLGRSWYDQGRMAHKRNTFFDFIDVTRALPQRAIGHPNQVFAMGGSAGGLLMGVVANLAPELYRGMIAQVPFVDVVTTMLDEDIPLTTGEYDEWGDPNIESHYRTMLEYSPYDQVRAQDYPNLLVTTGLHDSQVQYWEPLKWVARLRQLKTDQNLLLLNVDMDAGHSGASGRYRQFEERALEYAFLLYLMDGAETGSDSNPRR